ncbi:Hypothetical protein SMAX5B_013824 [Scophthalmus maximus]|uniref:Uncharacterized protein n=1 Tax=Scophthalmus maximus TaxID=52904 RepID=A0A2U9CGL0_SCOMX|nr:Hypothetical protein SMAX5B_013824 [Scophthalmus maximus]
MDDPATSRGQLRRRAPPAPQPSVRSRGVNQRLFHRGNPALLGVPAQPGTICPRTVTQERRCQGGFPLTSCTLRVTWARPGSRQIHHHWSLDVMEGPNTSMIQ